MAWYVISTTVQGSSAQSTLISSDYKGAESICISGVTRGFQQLTVLEDEVLLTGNKWQKHPIVDWPRGSVHPWHKLPQERIFHGPKRTLVCFWYSFLRDGGY